MENFCFLKKSASSRKVLGTSDNMYYRKGKDHRFSRGAGVFGYTRTRACHSSRTLRINIIRLHVPALCFSYTRSRIFLVESGQHEWRS